MVILYTLSSFSLIYGGLGVGLLGYGVGSGLRGQGFQLMGFGPVVRGFLGSFGTKSDVYTSAPCKQPASILIHSLATLAFSNLAELRPG